MARVDLHIKRGDLEPPVARVLRGVDGHPVDLTSADSVVFLMELDGHLVIDRAPVTVTDPPAGAVRFDWRPGDTDIAGAARAEFEVTWINGGPQTFPTPRYVQIRITEDLG